MSAEYTLADGFADQFCWPRVAARERAVYLCGNSLGLQPLAARHEVELLLDAWAEYGVLGHTQGPRPFMTYHERARDGLARLVGARPDEVVAMNSLTANLHLAMAGFYRPAGSRRAIVIEQGAFPSDRHAVCSQLRWHGLDPAQELIEVPIKADGCHGLEGLQAVLKARGDEIALVLWPGVQYYTGEAFDLHEVARLARVCGAVVGFDLAHAVGNLVLDLHGSGVDFAVWCSYKYLNSGPGAVAGMFVHHRHALFDGPRLNGWWGHQLATRFAMRPDFEPTPGADGWQLSNPQVLAMAPLLASLALFDQAGMASVRTRALHLGEAFLELLDTEFAGRISVLTPRQVERRGAQLSLRFHGLRHSVREVAHRLEAAGVIADVREPDVMRVTLTGMYNRIDELDPLREALGQALDG